MIFKILISLLSIGTLLFLLLTVQRLTMDYSENDVYFDGTTTYTKDAILVYASLTVILAILTSVTALMMYKKQQSALR